MGCLQATEVIKLILGRKEGLLSGRVLVFDAMKMKFSEIGLSRSKDRAAITELIDYQGFCGGPQTAPPEADKTTNARTMDEGETDTALDESSDFHTIHPKAALEKLMNGWSPWVIDVRLQTENDIVALPFTDRLVPHRAIRVKDIPKSGDVLVYCKAGVRGKKACTKLIEEGVSPERLYNLEGGILRWQEDIDPSMPRY